MLISNPGGSLICSRDSARLIAGLVRRATATSQRYTQPSSIPFGRCRSDLSRFFVIDASQWNFGNHEAHEVGVENGSGTSSTSYKITRDAMIACRRQELRRYCWIRLSINSEILERHFP